MSQDSPIADGFKAISKCDSKMFEAFLNQRFLVWPIDASGQPLDTTINREDIANIEQHQSVLAVDLIEVKTFPDRQVPAEFKGEQFSLLFQGASDTVMNSACLCEVNHPQTDSMFLFVTPVQLGAVPVLNAAGTERYYEIVFS